MDEQAAVAGAKKEFKPYVGADIHLKEFTFTAVALGMILSVVLGAANAYLGLKAGLTVAATFPAAVIAMAVLKLMRGTILEENTARTTAAVGEALAAGAIFTVPAFIISGVWRGENALTDHYLEVTALLVVGGVIGVLFVIFLRRILLEDATLPFPESVACSEIVKAGQKSTGGAGFVFGALGIGALIQFIKSKDAFQLFSESTGGFISFMQSKIQFLVKGRPFGPAHDHEGGIFIQSPAASPALMGVGYIIGARLSAIVFAGGVLAWFLFVPLMIFLNSSSLATYLGVAKADGSYPDWPDLAGMVWYSQVRPLAVGAMIVGAFYTLYRMRKSLWAGITRTVRDMRKLADKTGVTNRLEQDIPIKVVVFSILALIAPMAGIYYVFSKSVVGAIVAALVMTVAGFLFAAVAGFLVGTIGSSNNPISGLTLSTLIVAALLMLAFGVKGDPGVIAVLGVATVVCCSSGVAGDIMQDLKVGHILGGTPWKMELGCILGVLAAAFSMVFLLTILHKGMGIGSASLPAPQAGLMAMIAKGIVGGEMAWPLVLVGAAFSVAMILLNAPSPMLIAVGMYLPFESTSAIFVGGVIRYALDRIIERRKMPAPAKERAENTGTLLASGLIAGEALTGMLIAGLSILGVHKAIPKLYDGAWPALIVFFLMAYLFIVPPLREAGKALLEGEQPK
jgi:OPT family oligopeptide transporter